MSAVGINHQDSGTGSTALASIASIIYLARAGHAAHLLGSRYEVRSSIRYRFDITFVFYEARDFISAATIWVLTPYTWSLDFLLLHIFGAWSIQAKNQAASIGASEDFMIAREKRFTASLTV